MQNQNIDYLIDSAKMFYLNNFLQLLPRYTDTAQLINANSHQAKSYIAIIADIQLIFQANSKRELFYLKLYELINRISGCLEDFTHKEYEYFSNTKIRRLLVLHNQPLNWREILIQLRAFFAMIYAQLFQLTNLMFKHLNESLFSNNQEMYYGLIQTMSFPSFFQLLFEDDISKMLNYKINEIDLPQLTTDNQIYHYAKFVSLIITPLYELSKTSLDDIEPLIIFTLLSYHQGDLKDSQKGFIKKYSELIVSLIQYDQKASNWEAYSLMKIFTQMQLINMNFLTEFQNSILKAFEGINVNVCLNKGKSKKSNEKADYQSMMYDKEIFKMKELIYFLKSLKWIDTKRVITLEAKFKNYIVDIQVEGKAKVLSDK